MRARREYLRHLDRETVQRRDATARRVAHIMDVQEEVAKWLITEISISGGIGKSWCLPLLLLPLPLSFS
eukprot:COSAG05_NODE_324_length_11401_cov_6.009379_3_plen_69_part_00